jgi:dTDP-glucose pyrophosphorylase
MRDLDDLLVDVRASIRDAMTTIDRGAESIAFVVEADNTLLGTVSDGDLRRALLSGAELDDPVLAHVNREPVTVTSTSDRAGVLDLMRARRLSSIPVINDEGRLVGVHVLHEVVGGAPRPNAALVLAGGRGSRLGSMTESTPKPMLPVAGRPILERIILHLVGSGIREVFLSVSYLADRVHAHFGDGSEFGCDITYLREDPARPLGTGGPLRSLAAHRRPEYPVLVMNGDLITSFSVGGILDFHSHTQAALTVALSEYVHEVAFGVVERAADDPTLISALVEKPRWVGQVNAGIYVVEPAVFDLVPDEVPYPMTDLVGTCLEQGRRVAGWELTGDWHDIGRPHELSRARGEL